MLFPQPSDKILSEPTEPVDTACATCAATPLYRYRLADYRGWLRVVKCRNCLTIASSERIPAPAQTP